MEPRLQQWIRDVNQLAADRIPFFLLIDFELRQPVVYPLGDLPADIRFSTPGFELPSAEGRRSMPGPGPQDIDPPGREFEFHAEPVSFEAYRSAYAEVMEAARAGRTYLCNLTFPALIRTGLSIGDIYRISHARYKLCYRDEFVVFSPETFVQIRDGRIYSCPMKGTIDARLPDAEHRILADEKERAEHVTIVDLIRNDLSIHAREVKVERFRYIDHLHTNRKSLLQVSSVISGSLPEGYLGMLGDILVNMLPAGSVSGAPKAETLKIIRQAENGPRGYYTGIMGCFDGNDFDSAVLIRYIENTDRGMIYRSGGGLTFMSDPEKEYRELVDKIYIPVLQDGPAA